MKRYLLLILLIASLGMLAALDSDPSATVGYFKKSITPGGWEAFSLPFGYTDLTPNAVLGMQYGDFDQLTDIATNDNAIYLSDVGWVGTISEMTPGHAYWLNRDSFSPSLDYFIMGTVDPTPAQLTIHVSGSDGEGGWSAFGLNEAVSVDVNSLVMTGVVDFDMLINIKNGDNAIYLEGVGWVGTLATIDPSQAYWVNSTAPVSFDWYYPALRGGAAGSGNMKPSLESSRLKK
jgi:hypothetical protein